MRKSYIHKIAEEASRIEGYPLPRILKELRMREQSRSDARNIKKVTSDPRSGGLNRIIAPNPSTGEREELLNEREIVGACISENKKKYFQTYNTPSLMEPLLSKIGLKGDGPGVESILDGTFQFNNIDQYTEAYYKELKCPQNYTPIPDEEITPKINADDLKKQKKEHHLHHLDYIMDFGKLTQYMKISTLLMLNFVTLPKEKESSTQDGKKPLMLRY